MCRAPIHVPRPEGYGPGVAPGTRGAGLNSEEFQRLGSPGGTRAQGPRRQWSAKACRPLKGVLSSAAATVQEHGSETRQSRPCRHHGPPDRRRHGIPYASRKPLDVDAAVAELREIADGRGDLLAERAGVILGFHDEDARDGRWPRRALEAALCIAAVADLTGLTEWIAAGQEPAQRIR